MKSFSESKNRFSFAAISRFTFLAGAGTSVPSGLPTAWDFNKSLARFLSLNAGENNSLQNLLTVGYARNRSQRVRFEQIVQILRDFDPLLSILRIFDETGQPTYFHRFLAKAISHGATVFTTNFDSLIERAYVSQKKLPAKPLLQIIYEDKSGETHPGCVSFRQFLRTKPQLPALFKLHGSLRVLNRRKRNGLPDWNLDGLTSIGATLDKIGRPSVEFRLEESKESVLIQRLRNRILCVIGYSGADDFDITPSLALALKKCAGIIWIRHDPKLNNIIYRRSKRALVLLPSGIRAVCANKNAMVISGNSAAIIQRLFKFPVSAGLISPFNTRPVDAVLRGYEPYANMSQSSKNLIKARISQEAMDLPKAKRLYRKAVRNKNSIDGYETAVAFFHLGVIARIECKLGEALRYLKQAERYSGDNVNLKKRILNALGNVYLDTGELKSAHRFYIRAKTVGGEDNDKMLQSSVLTNLGLIERKLSNYGKALRYHKQALKLSTGSRNRSGMARDHGNIGTVYLRLKKYPAALVSYSQAIRLAKILGAKETLATTLMNRAIVLKHLKRFRQAERSARTALRLERSMRRTQGIARYYSLVAGLAYEQHKYVFAIRSLRKAIEIQTPLKRREGLADDWYSLGECYKKLHKNNEALKAYNKSRGFLIRLGDAKRVATVNKEIKSLRSEKKH